MQTPVPILALDVNSSANAQALADRFRSWFPWVKIGLELFCAEGPRVVTRLRESGFHVFLDLKLHDIPNTVEHAARAVAGLGVEMMTVHAAGGQAMLDAARQGAPDVKIVGVTVLTSIDNDAAKALWGVTTPQQVDRLVGMARGHTHGVVCSVGDAPSVRRVWEDALIVTPGVRLVSSSRDDQARVATPSAAAAAGADYVVIGRTVTASEHPEKAADEVLEQLRRGRAA